MFIIFAWQNHEMIRMEFNFSEGARDATLIHTAAARQADEKPQTSSSSGKKRPVRVCVCVFLSFKEQEGQS
jgi:hypothetical protein